jgi:co-chaperonin GroES (HSP10)
MINTSGIHPTEFRCLVLPDEVGEKDGSIFMPDQTREQEQWATTRGIFIEAGPMAFSDWGKNGIPKPGDRIIIAKYSGRYEWGVDLRQYRVVNDKEVLAILEQEYTEEEKQFLRDWDTELKNQRRFK